MGQSLIVLQRRWQPPLLCSLAGLITCGPGQRVSPLCLIWTTAIAPSGPGRLYSNMLHGITEQIAGTSGPNKSSHDYMILGTSANQDKGGRWSTGQCFPAAGRFEDTEEVKDF